MLLSMPGRTQPMATRVLLLLSAVVSRCARQPCTTARASARRRARAEPRVSARAHAPPATRLCARAHARSSRHSPLTATRVRAHPRSTWGWAPLALRPEALARRDTAGAAAARVAGASASPLPRRRCAQQPGLPPRFVDGQGCGGSVGGRGAARADLHAVRYVAQERCWRLGFRRRA